MDQVQKKNNLTIIIIFAMAIIPFGLAWYISVYVNWTDKGTNNGQLVLPVITTELSEFSGFDEFSSKHMNELRGRWVLVNVIANKQCNLTCQQAMHKTKQLRLMMNKDLTRIRRLVLITSDVNVELAKQWWKEDLRLLRSKPAITLVKKIENITNADISDGMLLLMDPLGNIMMQYETEFDVYKVKSDLSKLLRISQIG